jgi:hypothetical protein
MPVKVNENMLKDITKCFKECSGDIKGAMADGDSSSLADSTSIHIAGNLSVANRRVLQG